ncbi:MAG: tetraacyldisaccharide 4'-kinase [Armatimonadota bacterium]|jgi:tetraacyldisaccharide 4'-kinase
MSLAEVWQEVISGRRRGPWAELLGFGLRLLGPLYGVGAMVHRGVYERGALRRHTLDCPVLSVGNITTGGTGKTSAVILLAKALLQRGATPAILLRGHGRRAGGTLILSDGRMGGDVVAQAGDEACMVARMLPDAVVAVGKRRVEAGRQVLAETNADILVLDDGFQYYPLVRDLDIVLLDALWAGAADRMFPAGTLREHLSNLRRADALWLTHVDVAQRAATEALWRLVPGMDQRTRIETRHHPALLRRPDRTATEQTSVLRGQTLGALSSVGNPLAFELGLRRLGAAAVRPLRFPDHHRYMLADLEHIRSLAEAVDVVITTEKDAVRLPLPTWELGNLWILRCEMQFVRGGQEALRMVDECLRDRL